MRGRSQTAAVLARDVGETLLCKARLGRPDRRCLRADASGRARVCSLVRVQSFDVSRVVHGMEEHVAYLVASSKWSYDDTRDTTWNGHLQNDHTLFTVKILSVSKGLGDQSP